MGMSWKRGKMFLLSQESFKNIRVRSVWIFFCSFKKIFTASFLHSLHSLNNIEAKESWVWMINLFRFFWSWVVKLRIKNLFLSCFFLSHSLRVHLNWGNFLIIFKIAHVKIVLHSRMAVFMGGCGHAPSFSFPLCQVRDLAALSSGCLLLVTVSLARHHPLSNLPSQPGAAPWKSACLVRLKML